MSEKTKIEKSLESKIFALSEKRLKVSIIVSNKDFLGGKKVE